MNKYCTPTPRESYLERVVDEQDEKLDQLKKLAQELLERVQYCREEYEDTRWCTHPEIDLEIRAKQILSEV